MNDDYYELLGVDAAADTTEIRSAYRDKKAAITDQGAKADKGETARLNKAWNVLSDPYQRGRYDAQREGGDSDAADGVGGEVEVVGAAATGAAGEPAPRRRLFEPRPRQPRAPLPPPSIELPAGKEWAPQKNRLIAMAIDVVVMVVILFGVQNLVGDRLVERWYPQEHAQLTAITDDPAGDDKSQIEEAKDKADASDEAADEAEESDSEDAAELRDQADADKDAYDELNDEVTDLSGNVAPAGIVVLEGILLACFLYLFVPSAISGQTLGKRTQKIRVLRQNGEPLGWGGSLYRYGLIILATNAVMLIPLFGLLGIPIIFFFVLGWMRNSNHQGLHDRVSKTIVVTP